MVSLDTHSPHGPRRLTLAPHRSLSWGGARFLLAVLAAVTLTVALGFAAMGLPLVLPFAGLELLAVALAFHVSLREGRLREVVSITPDSVRVERGLGRPDESLSLPTPWVRVTRGRGHADWHPRTLLIGVRDRQVELGSFLSEGERDVAAALLRHSLERAGKARRA